jgi:uncharacterized protein (DUF4415 family)
MTSEEIDKKYPLNGKAIKKIKEALKNEPDMTDPDAPDFSDLLKNKIAKLPIALRLPAITLKKLRASGKGWQTRLSDKISELVMKGLL